MTPRFRHACLAGCLLAVLASAVQAQGPDLLSDRQPGPVVTGAPYAADSVLTVTLTSLGSPVEQRVVARVYRDSAGRVRREQTVTGQERPASSDPDLVVTILDPVAGVLITLNPASRTATRIPFGARRTADAAAPPAVAPRAESLGTQFIEGIAVSGRRTVTALPPGRDGRAVEISDERWESSDLQIPLIERHRDSRSGVSEHRLTNIVRTEPAAQLFVIPSSYTIVDVTIPATR
ncbi:MAG TPA: hypothetical protein VF424_05090 [Vicinamibacterales bacterium]